MTLFNVRDTFGSVHNPFESPTVPLSSVGLDQIFGGRSDSDTGENITETSALAIPTVMRCVGLLSTVIAGCPIRTYKNPGKQELFPRLFDQGNAAMLYTQFELWELIVVHLCLWGNAYVLKVRGEMDQIIDLRPISPDIVKVKLIDGRKVFLVQRLRPDGTIDQARRPEVLTDFEVMHIPGMGFDGLQGISPIIIAKRTLGTAVAADKLAGRFFSRGTQLSGVINVKAPLASQEQADEIRRKWAARNGGVAHSAEVAVLDAETEFQPLTIDPEALQFLESRRWETTEICRMFGIPPHLVGDVEKSTSWGTGIEQQNIGFIAYNISGWTNRIQQRATRELVPTRGQFSEFDVDHLMRGSMAERYQAYGNAIQWGWMARNEARVKENMEPEPGLDQMITPSNMVTGNPPTAKQMAAQNTPPPPSPDDDKPQGNNPKPDEDSS